MHEAVDSISRNAKQQNGFRNGNEGAIFRNFRYQLLPDSLFSSCFLSGFVGFVSAVFLNKSGQLRFSLQTIYRNARRFLV
jgi:hypothetical protein